MKAHPSLCHPERSRGICSSAGSSWKCFSTEYRCRLNCKCAAPLALGPCWGIPSAAGLGCRFGGRPLRQAQGRLYGLQGPDRFTENISRTSLQNCQSSASLGMTKGRVVLPLGLVAGGENRRSPFDYAPGRLSTSLRSGRDDNSYLGTGCRCPRKLPSLKSHKL